MDHNDIRHSLSEFLEGPVSGEQKTEIEAHLKTCAECSKALEDLRKTIEQLKAIEQVEPPAWMTQKIMANVREEAAKKKSFFEKIFYPLTIKLRLQAVAVVFLAVTAFYIYQETHPTAKYAEAPAPSKQEFTAKKEAQQQTQSGMSDQDASLSRAKQVPQPPSYKSSDMKPQYEKPSTPSARNEMPASAPAAKPAPEKKEMMLERRAFEQETTTSGAAVADKNASTDSVKKTKSRSTQAKFQQDMLERHLNGNPKLVITYEFYAGQKFKRAEERFNAAGERDGIQKEFYRSGQLKTEAHYEAGTLRNYAEYGTDGTKKTGVSDYDWFWLKK